MPCYQDGALVDLYNDGDLQVAYNAGNQVKANGANINFDLTIGLGAGVYGYNVSDGFGAINPNTMEPQLTPFFAVQGSASGAVDAFYNVSFQQPITVASGSVIWRFPPASGLADLTLAFLFGELFSLQVNGNRDHLDWLFSNVGNTVAIQLEWIP